MPPKVKFQKEEIVEAALQIAREKGIDAVTAREVGTRLNVSSRPIFTWFSTMDELKREVYEQAKALYRNYIERGLAERIPFLGVWHQYIAFAKEEPELYRLLFLTRPDGVTEGAADSLQFSQDLVRDSLMEIYHLSAFQADCYFRNIWLIGFSFATLLVTDDCPYTEEYMFAVGTEVSLAICKAYKEIPGLAEGDFDRDAIFSELVKE